MRIILTAAAIAALFFACGKSVDDQPTPGQIGCTGDCLFTVVDADGTIIEMNCFNRLGILTDDPNTPQRDTIFGLPDWLGSEFSEVGKAVKFSATFRSNTLTPQFPDPMIGPLDIFQIDITDIQGRD